MTTETTIPFTAKSLILTPDSPLLEGDREEIRDVSIAELGTHWGQRKLADTVLHFLIHHWDPAEHPEPLVVYVGAAEGTNIGLISRLFPSIQWALYDPRPFVSDTTDMITIHTGDPDGWFGNEQAEEWGRYQEEHGGVFFISDIRIVHDDISDYYERTKQIMKDMYNQQEWCQKINPVAAQLKFPFVHLEKRGEVISNRYFEYMEGIVYLQAWNRPKSYETRLVCTEYEDTILWDLKTARSQIDYVNFVKRLEPHHVESNEGYISYGIPETGLDNSFDACAEMLTWAHYLEKHGEEVTDGKIKILAAFLSKTLNNSIENKKTTQVLRE